MSRRKSVKRGRYASIEDIKSNVFDDLEGEARLSALVDEAEEVLRQRQIAQQVNPQVKLDALIDGSSLTAEQQVARRLVFGDGELGTLPPDRYRGEDLRVRQLGVDGQIKPDSVVTGGTTGGLVNGVLDVQRNGVLTEYLSPTAEERLFRDWQNSPAGKTALSQIMQQVDKPRSRIRQNDVPGLMQQQFNSSVAEYYGQQMLRTIGATPVADRDRSDKVVRGIRKDPGPGNRPEPLPVSQSTAGTDRLIENSVGLLSPDIDLSGDFRYMMDGQVRVGDYQTGNPEDTVRLNLLKSMRGPGTDITSVRSNWNTVAGRLEAAGVAPTADRVIKSMLAQGLLPEIKQGSSGIGVRGGKAMSASPLFADQNRESQFRYDDILYGHSSPSRRSQPRGYIPEDVILVDTRKAGDALALSPVELFSSGTELNAAPKITDLIAAGAARRLTDDPRIKQLLP